MSDAIISRAYYPRYSAAVIAAETDSETLGWTSTPDGTYGEVFTARDDMPWFEPTDLVLIDQCAYDTADDHSVWVRAYMVTPNDTHPLHGQVLNVFPHETSTSILYSDGTWINYKLSENAPVIRIR